MGKLDVIGGDERKIGYYAGLIVEFNFPTVSKMRQVLMGPAAIAGIVIFRNRGYHCISMESNIRSYWEKASPPVWDGRNDFIHVVFRIVSYILDPCDQVRLGLYVVCWLVIDSDQSAGVYVGC